MSATLAPAALKRNCCEVPTTCQPPSAWSKDPWPAVIRSIEPNGVSLTLGRRFERGSGLAIKLPAEDGTFSTVLARVTAVEPFGASGWQLSCSFISELSEDEVRQVLHLDPVYRASLGGDSDTVTEATPPAVEGVLFQAQLGPNYLRWFVKHLDLSANWPIAAGKTVTLGLTGPDGASLPVELSVSNCRPRGEYWVVDGQFATRPGVEALRVLGAPVD